MTYDLKDVSLPKLGTTGLRVVVALAESPIVGPLLVEKLKKDGGLAGFDQRTPDEVPTMYPHLPADTRALPPLVRATAPTTAPGFHFPSVDDYHEAYRSGRTTPTDVATQFLARVDESERGDRPLRAFVAINRDDVLAQARASTDRWRAGRPLGLFDGVPVGVKDEMDVAGYPTAVGTKFLGRTPATHDATVVARMRAAGALIVGKTNMHEIGINITGLNPHHGCTRNPYNDRYHTGASSSGSGTAVAAGLVPVAIGADGGGSIRIPAALCGVVGIKSTFGRVSEHGAFPLCWSLGYLGPIAATVRDTARAWAIMAGHDTHDANTADKPEISLDESAPASLAGIRLGIYRPWFEHATADVVQHTDRLLQQLVARGATLHDVEIPELDAQRIAHIVSITSEMTTSMERHYAEHRRDFGLDVRVNLALARSFGARDYLTAQRIRTRAQAIWAHAFADVDAIITPTTGQTAPAIDERSLPNGNSDLSMSLRVMRFCQPANLTGHPAITMPAGYDSNGLPIGLQAIGRPWGERLLFRIAAMAEQIVERRAPTRWHPVLDA